MTAVEFLLSKTSKHCFNKQEIEQALQMEKQQIIDAHGIKTKSINQDQSELITGSQYYDETFKK